MVENLFYKCINNQLTESESKLLLLILSYFSLNNVPYSDEKMNNYLNNYFYKDIKYFIGEELVLINNFIVSFISKMFNISSKLKYGQNFESLASVSKNNGIVEIKIFDIYSDLLKMGPLSEETFYDNVVSQTFVLLHEFWHSRQFELLVNNKEYQNRERIKKEYVVIANDRDFYLKYHNNFKTEKEANDFASKHLKSLLKDVVPLERIDSFLNKIFSELEDNNLDDDEFEKILDMKSEKELAFSDAIINNLKTR